MVAIIVFKIHCNFFIVLTIRLKTCRSNSFFVFWKAKCAHPKNRACLWGFARSSGHDRHRPRNLSGPDMQYLEAGPSVTSQNDIFFKQLNRFFLENSTFHVLKKFSPSKIKTCRTFPEIITKSRVECFNAYSVYGLTITKFY